MALYVNGTTIAQSGAAVGGIEQVAVLPTVGATDHIYFLTVADATHPVGLYYFDGTVWHSTGSGGGEGTDDYNDLNNKPRINGIELQGNKSLPMLDIAQASITYTKLQVDELISASQKVYLQSTPPTAASNVGLYYVGNVGDTNYAMWLVDSNKVVTNLGSAGISLDGYQKEQDFGLDTTVKTVVGGINELKYRLDNLPSGGTITMNGVVTGSPTFYAPTDSGTFGQRLVSYGPYQAPQWVTDSGETGTKVHLNGSATVVPETYIYAPTNSGAAGFVLKSQGEGLAPQWVAPSAADSPTMTLNGTVKEVSASAVNIYAPLASGQDGYILKSKGPGLSPVWEAPGAADGAYMTLNDEETAVTVDKVKVYSPKDSGTKAKMLVGNETTSTPTWEVSCRSVTLTKAEYDDLSTTKKNDPNIIYYITDDIGAGTTEDPAIRWDETLTAEFTGATDKQIYTAKAINTIKQAVFDAIYPVGSYAFGSKPSMGTWTQVTGDRALWLKSSASDGSTINQGLPDIQGTMPAVFTASDGNRVSTYSGYAGAISADSTTQYTGSRNYPNVGGKSDTGWYNKISFKASSYNSIYGASSNVQPNAYVMTVWKRTA